MDCKTKKWYINIKNAKLILFSVKNDLKTTSKFMQHFKEGNFKIFLI